MYSRIEEQTLIIPSYFSYIDTAISSTSPQICVDLSTVLAKIILHLAVWVVLTVQPQAIHIYFHFSIASCNRRAAGIEIMAIEGSRQSAAGKAKKRKSKKMSAKNKPSLGALAVPVVTAPKRDFKGDLAAYLEQWRNRSAGSDWKFNKILQSWAIQNAMNKKLVDKDLFKALCPYLATIVGVQRQRFVEAIEGVIDAGEHSGPDGAADADADKLCYSRAMKLRTVMEDSSS